MTRPSDSQEAIRKDALSAFLEARVGEGCRVETRTDTHAIIVRPGRRWLLLNLLRRDRGSTREVVSVDQHGDVTVRAAEPLRS